MVHAAEKADQVCGLVLSGCSADYGGLFGVAAKGNATALKLVTRVRVAASIGHPPAPR